ncbi:FAD-binding oxidoreductase [Herbidospora sp. RD11066]
MTLLLGPNAGRFRQRDITAVLRPADVASTVAAVVAARAGGLRLHPVSTGRNWGLGSREPVADGTALLDLSGLSQIREVDVRAGYAIVEPGVTQQALAAALAGTGRMPNLTGASLSTSVLGNLVERGVGLHRQRTEDLAGLEVVLADGTVARVGWWPDTAHPAAVYPHGVGPSLNHLFTQSDLAVVTAAVVRLPPRPEAVRILPFTFPEERLADAVDLLREWTAQRLVPPCSKIYNPVTARGYVSDGSCLAQVCLSGASALVEAVAGILASLAPAWLAPGPPAAAGEAVRAAYSGLPDPDDTFFARKSAGGAEAVDGRGLLLFLPLIPFTGVDAVRAGALASGAARGPIGRPGVIMNVLDADTLDHLVSIGFDPGDEVAAAAAHETLSVLHTEFAAARYHPYRYDVDHPAPGRDGVVRGRIKHALDPEGVFAPGRH